MPETILTDTAYEPIERLEGRKKWMVGVVVACFVLAPLRLGFDLFIVGHEKGGLSDLASNPFIRDHSPCIHNRLGLEQIGLF
jgi:hypothetical protein